MSFISLLKSIPVDLGQGSLRGTTKGKEIALSQVPDGHGKSALDVGCREGHQSELLKKRGFTVTSVDIEKVYQHAMIMHTNKTWPFEENTFDLTPNLLQ